MVNLKFLSTFLLLWLSLSQCQITGARQLDDDELEFVRPLEDMLIYVPDNTYGYYTFPGQIVNLDGSYISLGMADNSSLPSWVSYSSYYQQIRVTSHLNHSEPLTLRLKVYKSTQYIYEDFVLTTRPATDVETRLRVNEYKSGSQVFASLSRLPTQNSLVVWTSDDAREEVYYSIVNPNTGEVIVGETLVHEETERPQVTPTTAVAPNGYALIAWIGECGGGCDPSEAEFFATIIDTTDGSTVIPAFAINDTNTAYETEPFLLTLEDGTIFASWMVESKLNCKTIDPLTGNDVAPEFALSETAGATESTIRVLQLEDGNVMVMWKASEIGSDTDGAVAAKIIDPTDGSTVVSDFKVNDTDDGIQSPGTVTQFSGGDVLLTWIDENGLDGDDNGLFAKIVTSDTAATVVDEFQVNTSYTDFDQDTPLALALTQDKIFIVWESYGLDNSREALAGVVVNASGDKVTNEYQINTVESGDQKDVRMDHYGDGSVLIVFRGYAAVLNPLTATYLYKEKNYDYTLYAYEYDIYLQDDGTIVVAFTDYGYDGDRLGLQLTTADPTIGDRILRIPTHKPDVINDISDQVIQFDNVWSFSVETAPIFVTYDEQDLTYRTSLDTGLDLPSWIFFNASTGTFSGTPLEEDIEDISILVTATNEEGAPITTTFDLSVQYCNLSCLTCDGPATTECLTCVIEEILHTDSLGSSCVGRSEDNNGCQDGYLNYPNESPETCIIEANHNNGCQTDYTRHSGSGYDRCYANSETNNGCKSYYILHLQYEGNLCVTLSPENEGCQDGYQLHTGDNDDVDDTSEKCHLESIENYGCQEGYIFHSDPSGDVCLVKTDANGGCKYGYIVHFEDSDYSDDEFGNCLPTNVVNSGCQESFIYHVEGEQAGCQLVAQDNGGCMEEYLLHLGDNYAQSCFLLTLGGNNCQSAYNLHIDEDFDFCMQWTCLADYLLHLTDQGDVCYHTVEENTSGCQNGYTSHLLADRGYSCLPTASGGNAGCQSGFIHYFEQTTSVCRTYSDNDNPCDSPYLLHFDEGERFCQYPEDDNRGCLQGYLLHKGDPENATDETETCLANSWSNHGCQNKFIFHSDSQGHICLVKIENDNGCQLGYIPHIGNIDNSDNNDDSDDYDGLIDLDEMNDLDELPIIYDSCYADVLTNSGCEQGYFLHVTAGEVLCQLEQRGNGGCQSGYILHLEYDLDPSCHLPSQDGNGCQSWYYLHLDEEYDFCYQWNCQEDFLLHVTEEEGNKCYYPVSENNGGCQDDYTFHTMPTISDTCFITTVDNDGCQEHYLHHYDEFSSACRESYDEQYPCQTGYTLHSKNGIRFCYLETKNNGGCHEDYIIHGNDGCFFETRDNSGCQNGYVLHRNFIEENCYLLSDDNNGCRTDFVLHFTIEYNQNDDVDALDTTGQVCYPESASNAGCQDGYLLHTDDDANDIKSCHVEVQNTPGCQDGYILHSDDVDDNDDFDDDVDSNDDACYSQAELNNGCQQGYLLHTRVGHNTCYLEAESNYGCQYSYILHAEMTEDVTWATAEANTGFDNAYNLHSGDAVKNCHYEVETNSGCQGDYLFQNSICLQECDHDLVQIRYIGNFWIQDADPEVDIVRDGSHVDVSFITPFPPACFRGALIFEVASIEGGDNLGETLFKNTDGDWQMDLTLSDDQLNDTTHCTKSDLNGSSFYSCPLHVSGYYTTDLIYEWGYYLTIQLSDSGFVLNLSIETQRPSVEIETIELAIEDILVNGSDGTAKEDEGFSVGDDLFMKLTSPEELGTEVVASVDSVIIYDFDTTPPKEFHLTHLIMPRETGPGELVLPVPLIVSSPKAEVAATVTWTLDTTRRLADDSNGVESSTLTYTVEIEIDEDVEEEEEEEESMWHKNAMIFAVSAIAIFVISLCIIGVCLYRCGYRKARKDVTPVLQFDDGVNDTRVNDTHAGYK